MNTKGLLCILKINDIMDTTSDAPFFSIILPVFNGEKFISETIQSILQQSFTNWELIVIDDGSTDKSAGIVKDFCKLDNRIKLLQQTNKKQPAARNAGMKIAQGEWIAFIDADDLWLPAKLELQYQFINKNANVDVVFSNGYTKYHDKRIWHYYHFEIVSQFYQQ
jgi:glycosyltransferase involved in cell wall biosynthesis